MENLANKKLARELDRARKAYIEAQIKAEKGVSGTLRKLGFNWMGSLGDLNYFLETRRRYYEKLDNYRAALIKGFKKRKKVKAAYVRAIGKMTIFEELEKLRAQKEGELRAQGLRGVIRAQLQEWREITPGFKMIFGLVFVGIFIALRYVTFVSIGWFANFFLIWGVMIFLEGAQQKITRVNAARKGMNRLFIFKAIKTRLPVKVRGLKRNLAMIYKNLEENIWNLRIFEKRTEYRRYILAILGGALAGILLFIPEGTKVGLFNFAMAVMSRLFWFILPYGAMRDGFSALFGSSDKKTRTAAELSAGEGSEGLKEAEEDDIF